MQRAWILLVISLIILGFALATGHPMFWRSFYIFGLLLVVSFAWVWVLIGGVEVEVQRPGGRARAGGSVRERVLVRRRNRFLRGFLEVREDSDMPVRLPGAVLSMDDADDVAVELDLPCPRRGVFRLGPAKLTGSDPFGMFRLERGIGDTDRLIVHPATMDLPGFVLLPADLPGEGPRHLRSQHVTTSAFSVRDYVHGDSLNRIAWKATAHRDRLMVKEFEIEPTNNIWVLLDMERKAHTGSGDEGTEETCVALGASICKRYVDAGYPVGMMAYGSHRIALPSQRGSGQLVRILDALSEVRALGNDSLLHLIADLHDRAGRYTSVAIVTSSTSADWLDGVRHLMERRCRITLVLVDPDLSREDYPETAYQAAGLGVPTYVVKRGRALSGGLTALTAAAHAGDPRRPAGVAR